MALASTDPPSLPPLDAAAVDTLFALLEGAPVGLALLDTEARYLRINAALAELNGLPPEQHVGRTPAEVLPAPLGARVVETLRGVAATGVPVRNFDQAASAVAPGGAAPLRHRRAAYVPVQAEGRVVGVAALVVETTVQHQETERFRSLVLASSQAVWTADAEGRGHPEQDSWDRLTGYGPDNPRPEPWIEAVHPEDKARVREAWAEALASGEPMTMEYRVRRADGSYLDALARAVPVRGADGRVREWVGTLTDVTAQRAAARRSAHLHLLTARLSKAVSPAEVARAAVEEVLAASGAAHAAVFGLDAPRGQETGPQLVALHQVGAPPEEVGRVLRVPLSLPSLAPEVVRQRQALFFASYPELLARFPRAVHFPYLQRLGAFAALPLEVRARAVGVLLVGLPQPGALRPEDQAFLTACAQATAAGLERAQLFEAEARGRRVAELRATRARFLADTMRELTASLDLEATLSTVVRLAVPDMADHCALELLEEGGGLRRVDFATVDTSLEEDVVALLRRTAPRMQPGGGLADVLRAGRALLGPALTDADLRAMAHSEAHLAALRRLGVRSRIHAPLVARGRTLGMVTLVSRQEGFYTQEDVALADEVGRVAALALDNARLFRDARDAVRARDDFLAVASHELKTPLTSLRLQLQLLTDTLRRAVPAPVRAGVEARTEGAHRQAARLAVLVDRLLDVSRLVTGRLRLEPEEADLAALVRGCAERLAGELAEAGSSLELHAPEAVRGHWDVLRVEQVVTNLLSNAGRYGRGRPVRVAVTAEGGWARVVVEDAGVGIAAGDLERVFGKFERAVGVRHQGGMGLGLHVARELVVAMGGRIEVDSRLDEGSRFSVLLPVQSPSAPG